MVELTRKASIHDLRGRAALRTKLAASPAFAGFSGHSEAIMGTTAAPTPAGVDLEPSAGGPGFWDILLRRTALGKLPLLICS